MWLYYRRKRQGDSGMIYKRAIKFQYYQIVSINTKNASKRLFNFAKWIDCMADNNLIQMEISFNEAKARIEQFNINANKEIWGIKLFKLRDTNIPSKAKNNEEAKVIELEDGEYIGEDMFLIFDPNNGIALIQRNRLSLGISRLEEFFTFTYNKYVDEQNKIEVYIEPILDLHGKGKIYSSKYKNLEISFANINEWVLNENRISLGTLLQPLKNMYGVNGSIKISLGHSRLDTLNRKFIKDLVKEISEPSNKRYVRAAKIKIQEEDDCDVEIIDLFNDICDEYLEVSVESSKGLGYTMIINAMIEKYMNRKNNLEECLDKK